MNRQEPRARQVPLILVGTILAGVALLMLFVLVADQDDTRLAQSAPQLVNGTFVTALRAPFPYYEDATIHVQYELHEAGAMQLLTCRDYERLVAGQAPERPLLESDAPAGELHIHPDELPPRRERLSVVGDGYCGDLYVAFLWPEAAGREAAPVARGVLRQGALDEPVGAALVGLLALGVALTLWGALRTSPPSARGAPAAEAGTTEVLLGVLHEAGAWLERTRRYLLVAGIVGLGVWYPALPLLAWVIGREGSQLALTRWLLVGLAVVLLAALTLAWQRFYRRLTDEWMRWRAWIDRLEERERELFGEGPG